MTCYPSKWSYIRNACHIHTLVGLHSILATTTNSSLCYLGKEKTWVVGKGTFDWLDLYSKEVRPSQMFGSLIGMHYWQFFFFFQNSMSKDSPCRIYNVSFPITASVSLWKGGGEACNCSFAPFSMKMDFLMWVSLHPRALPNLIWSRTLLLYCRACYAHH